MAENRTELVQEFTRFTLDSIAQEASAIMQIRRQTLAVLTLRVPVRLKVKLVEATRTHGTKQTTLILHVLGPMLASILEEDSSLGPHLDLARDFTTLVLDSIAQEKSSKMKPRHPVLDMMSIRMPRRDKLRLKKAVKLKGVEQTQLVIHSLVPVLGVLLREQLHLQMMLIGEEMQA